MIKSSLLFTFGEHDSTDFNLYNINISPGMAEELFGFERTIIKQSIRGRTKKYYHGVEVSPKIYKLSCMHKGKWDTQKLSEIRRWLFSSDFYQKLSFSDEPERVYYAMVVDEPQIVHDYNDSGYINLTFECDDIYAYSPIQNDPFYLSNNVENGTIITINNIGDIPYCPALQITKKVENGLVSIVNLSDGNKEFKILNLNVDEITMIDNENKIITSSLNGIDINRYGSHNDYFISLPTGENRLKVLGKCDIIFTSEFKYY